MRDKNINQIVGARIRYFRKARGMTIVDLASIMHISKSTVSKYERGEIAITVEQLSAFAEVMNIDLFQLLDENHLPEKFSVFQSKENVEEQMEKYFAYAWTGHGKAYLSKQVLFLGTESGYLYGEIKNEYNYRNCKYFYTGEVRTDSSHRRALLVNPLNRDDILILDIQNSLGNKPLQYVFGVSLSVGINYPLAFRWLISKTVIKDKNILKKLLVLSMDDLKTFKESGAFFVSDKDPRLDLGKEENELF